MTYKRILSPPVSSFFLFGPRGSGKSTWALKAFPNAHRIDLLDEALYQALLGNAGLFAARIAPLPEGTWVTVDEVQKLPSLLNEVHRHIVERGLRFVLLGSSARKLKAAGTNLLAGRALRKSMYPLLPEELGADFDLGRVLRYGSLPVIWVSDAPGESLGSYVQLYLKEEIRAEALVRNLPAFTRFLPVAALCHGQVVNIAALARDAGASRTTIAGYLDILEDTLIAFRVPAFEARLRVRERKHPKLYWIDAGIVRAAKGSLGPPSPEERGALFEGWIAMLLSACRDLRGAFDELSYWAPAESRKIEVDFLLRKGDEYVAIEAKAGARFTSTMTDGLRAIAGLPGLRRRILVYTGDLRLRVFDSIDVLPLPEFLRMLAQNALWP